MVSLLPAFRENLPCPIFKGQAVKISRLHMRCPLFLSDVKQNWNVSLIYIKIPAISNVLMKLLSVFFELLLKERLSKERSITFRNFVRNVPRARQISWRHFPDCAA